MTDAIALKDVDLSYGSRQVLRGFSLHLSRGSFSVLLGPNGAGKSTVFNLISGLLRPDQGRVEIMGQDMRASPRVALKSIGMVFQQSALDPELSVRQNLSYFAGLHGVPRAGARIASLLTKFELDGRASDPVRSLNGGHKRRLEIARALLPGPDILILDEPTTGLDPYSKQVIVDLVHAQSRQGATVLWITHLLDEIAAKDDVIVMQRGAISARGTITELGGIETLSAAYGTKARPTL